MPRSDTDSRERFSLYALRDCAECGGRGRAIMGNGKPSGARCSSCQGEGRTRDLVAEADTPEAVGVALVTLAREGEFEGVPFGLLDREGEKGHKWLVRPWLPSARNVSDAARTLRRART
jgi:hypothetical protein